MSILQSLYALQPTSYQRGSLADSKSDILQHAFLLLRRDHRSATGRGIHRVSRLVTLSPLYDYGHDLSHLRLGDDKAGEC